MRSLVQIQLGPRTKPLVPQGVIAAGVSNMTFRLTRQRRFIPAAVDIDGDFAATLFLRRGVSGSDSSEFGDHLDEEYFEAYLAARDYSLQNCVGISMTPDGTLHFTLIR